MLDWLKRKMLDRMAAAQRKELKTFLMALRRMGDEELGAVVFFTGLARVVVEQNAAQLGFAQGISLLAPLAFCQADTDCAAKLGRMIRECGREENPQLATGYLVWLHTVRGVMNPLLRQGACDVWGLLERGFPHTATFAANLGADLSKIPDYDAFPEGFKPEEAN